MPLSLQKAKNSDRQSTVKGLHIQRFDENAIRSNEKITRIPATFLHRQDQFLIQKFLLDYGIYCDGLYSDSDHVKRHRKYFKNLYEKSFSLSVLRLIYSTPNPCIKIARIREVSVANILSFAKQF